jgi:polysaccharide pyruvyl transferase WcaK-like protein/peptidoglycan/xylan/chitin deacetylase (PgdA/CDA1 family)
MRARAQLAKPTRFRAFFPKTRTPSAGTILRACAWLSLITAICSSAWGTDVVVVTNAGADTAAETQVRMVAEFYGLGVRDISVGGPQNRALVTDMLKQQGTVAAIISSGALSSLDRTATFESLRRADGSRVALLIMVTSPPYSSEELSIWTEGLIKGCNPIEENRQRWNLSFAKQDIARQLAGVALNGAGAPACGMVVSNNPAVRVVAEIRDEIDTFAAFLQFSIDAQPMFVDTVMRPPRKTQNDGAAQLQAFFSSIAGLAMFMRQAAGESAWHLPGAYANLTVDDPWLVEPYGNLGYRALLEEMEKHNFHTTIAFVPWNYDRSQPEVVSLFQEHADRFSLCIHGNNHNHREFGEYAIQPLARQEDNLKQALARMEELKKATGLPYDRVMVFPHAIAPAETLGLLKKANYWATVNSEKVPLGASAPADRLLALRQWTLAFGGFPSIKRTSAEVPVSHEAIAINAFLGNPQLFYVHQEVFEDKIGAFDSTADEINRVEPSIQWKSLGYIVRHLYLMQLRSDGDYDVSAVSPLLELANPTSRRVVFHVHRVEEPAAPLHLLMVDGAPSKYQVAHNEVQFDVVLEPRQTRHIDMSYGDGPSLASVELSTRSVLVTLDRRLSDFRDMRLSRSKVGREIQSLYYKHGLDHMGAMLERTILVIFVVAGLLTLRMLIARRKQNAPDSKIQSGAKAAWMRGNEVLYGGFPIRIGLIGASFETGNMGVGALAAGAIRCMHRQWPEAELFILDYAKEPSLPHRLVVDGTEITIPFVNIRFSKKIYRANNIALLLLLAAIVRIIPSSRIRNWILSRNAVLTQMHHSAMFASIAGGDSFSDIYGLRRLLYVTLPQILVILVGKMLVLLPQTFGPFRSRLSRIIGKFIIGKADSVYCRDHLSVTEIAKLHGICQQKLTVAFRYDVGFALEPVAPKEVATENDFDLASPQIVGLNVSGLLYMGGYDRKNMFGLRVDYREFVCHSLDLLIEAKGASVLLVPHVFGNAEDSESDVVACSAVYEAWRKQYGKRLGMLRGHYDQNEIKYVIGNCDFFVGSRMHACIAAMSQCVPTVAVAYSHKFSGVLETVGVPSVVADARKLNLEELLARVGTLYDRRQALRRELEKTMPQVVRAAGRPFGDAGDYVDGNSPLPEPDSESCSFGGKNIETSPHANRSYSDISGIGPQDLESWARGARH